MSVSVFLVCLFVSAYVCVCVCHTIRAAASAADGVAHPSLAVDAAEAIDGGDDDAELLQRRTRQRLRRLRATKWTIASSEQEEDDSKASTEF